VFAVHTSMSGPAASQALHDHFDTIRRAELARLKKKLSGLTAADRQFVDEITASVVGALTRAPTKALAEDTPAVTVDALVRLFALAG
jgi:glutamyl-tRNA reductase